MNRLGIEMLTLLGMPPAEHVALAADLGCTSISTGLSRVPLHLLGYPDWNMFPDWSLENDPALRRELQAALRDRGVRIALGEGFGARPGSDVRDRAAALDLMAELGAERINAISMEPDMPRGFDQLAILADMVAERGMGFTLEFAPPNAIGTLDQALAAIAHADNDKCQLLVDAMHFFRSGGQVADIAALDPGLIGYVQLCDAPLVPTETSYMQEAMFARMVPGTGELPLTAFIAALPADVAIGLEVPLIAAVEAEGSPHAHAARTVAAARALGA